MGANAYPELPSLPYQRTTVDMPAVVEQLRALDAPLEVRRAAYVMFRNESANGQKGINHNYVGAQADSGRWPAELTPLFQGTVIATEGGTGRQRIFLAFHGLAGCLAFLADRVRRRGLYIGGDTHRVLTMHVWTPADLARAYHKEWVRGDPTAELPDDARRGFLSMYAQALSLFS